MLLTSDFSLCFWTLVSLLTIIALLICFRVLSCSFALLHLFLTLRGIVFPLSVEVIIIRFFCHRFILLQIFTSISSFASVYDVLEFFNELFLDAANNFIPVRSAFHGLPSVLPSLEPKSAPPAIGYGLGPSGLNLT